jgi:hypothetical protein
MRHYFVATYNDDDNLQTLDDYEESGLDSADFWTCKEFRGQIPKSSKIWVVEGTPCDYLISSLSIPIVSDRFLRILNKFAAQDIQVLPAPFFLKKKNRRLPGFHIINILKLVDCLKNKKAYPHDWVFLGKRVPPNVHLFRPVGMFAEIMSEELVNEIRANELKGIAFIKTKTI